MGFEVILVLIIGITILIFKDIKDEFIKNKLHFLGARIVRWTIYVLLFCMIINYGVLDGGQFIYVNF